LPKNKTPLPMTLKLNGYSTAQFGKCHEVPVWETSPMGPFDQWPTGGGGFEYFYGFLGGETNQFYPAIYEGTTPVEPEKTPEEGYHFTEDMTNKAIKWVRQQKALMGDKPFFMYFAPGACHAPHHVPKEWADKYKGKFDQGWDKLREEIFARQKKLGVVPSNAELTQRPTEIPAWDEMPEELKPILARQMEIYAAFLEHTDHHLGRLVGALEDLEVLDDTLVFYIIGDNGASAEGTLNGTFNEMCMLNGMAEVETVEFLKSKIDDFGGPDAYNHYAVGWAHAMDAPTNGPSKWRRIGAARATARSSIGRRASKPRERFVRSSIMSSMSRRRSWRRQVYRSLRSSIACSRPPWRVSACSTRSTTPRRPRDTRPNISRCSATVASTTRAGPR
jgi:arylsulfatase